MGKVKASIKNAAYWGSSDGLVRLVASTDQTKSSIELEDKDIPVQTKMEMYRGVQAGNISIEESILKKWETIFNEKKEAPKQAANTNYTVYAGNTIMWKSQSGKYEINTLQGNVSFVINSNDPEFPAVARAINIGLLTTKNNINKEQEPKVEDIAPNKELIEQITSNPTVTSTFEKAKRKLEGTYQAVANYVLLEDDVTILKEMHRIEQENKKPRQGVLRVIKNRIEELGETVESNKELMYGDVKMEIETDSEESVEVKKNNKLDVVEELATSL